MTTDKGLSFTYRYSGVERDTDHRGNKTDPYKDLLIEYRDVEGFESCLIVSYESVPSLLKFIELNYTEEHLRG